MRVGAVEGTAVLTTLWVRVVGVLVAAESAGTAGPVFPSFLMCFSMEKCLFSVHFDKK